MSTPTQVYSVNPAAAQAVVFVSPASGVALTGSGQQVTTGSGTYYGVSIGETAGSTAKIRVWDSANSTTSGKTMLGPYSLAANETREEGFPRTYSYGVYVEVVSGAVEGTVFFV